MFPRTPGPTRTYTRFPYTTLVRSALHAPHSPFPSTPPCNPYPCFVLCCVLLFDLLIGYCTAPSPPLSSPSPLHSFLIWCRDLFLHSIWVPRWRGGERGNLHLPLFRRSSFARTRR